MTNEDFYTVYDNFTASLNNKMLNKISRKTSGQLEPIVSVSNEDFLTLTLLNKIYNHNKNQTNTTQLQLCNLNSDLVLDLISNIIK